MHTHTRSLVVALATLMTAHMAFSADIYWQNTGSGDWSQAGNWTPGIPSNTDTIYIGGSGTAALSSGSTAITALYVGGTVGGETGELLINGGTLTGSQPFYIGYKNNAQGSVTVSDGLLHLQGASTAGNLSVGRDYGGVGILTITGGTVANFQGHIAHNNLGASGTVSVSGGLWNNANNLYVGSNGKGVLIITGGTVFNAGVGFIGNAAGSEGSVMVSDSGYWQNNNELRVGFAGTGTLTVTGGTVTNPNAIVGAHASGRGSAVVSGSGLWATTGTLSIGAIGGGILTIQEGGIVRVANSVVMIGGATAPATGTLALKGGVLEAQGIARTAGAASGNATLILNGGTVRALQGTGSYFNLPGTTLTLDGTGLAAGAPALTIDTNGFDLTVSNTFTGDGAFGKTGGGKVILEGDNHATTGGLNLNEGVVQISSTLNLFGGALNGSGTLVIDNAGAFAFAAGHTGDFTGLVRLQASGLELGNAAPVIDGATLQLAAGGSATYNSNNGDTTIGSLDFAGGSLDLTYSPSGTLFVDHLGVSTSGTVKLGGLSASGPPGNLPANFIDQSHATGDGLLLIKANSVGDISQLRVDTGTSSGITSDLGPVVATYNYAGLSGSNFGGEKGLFISTVLQELAIKSGSTLVLNTDNLESNSTHTLAARISGADGNVHISAPGDCIILNANNTYTGTTTIASGTVRAATNDVLGHTSHLILSDNTTFDLNGATQSIGALTGGAGSTLALGSGSLAINGSGVTQGRITGVQAGFLSVSSGTVILNSANTDLHVTTIIGAGGSVVLNDGQALGDGAIIIENTTASLTLNNASAASFANTLSGNGTFLKTGNGLLALSGDNEGFLGTVDLRQGAIEARNSKALGSGMTTLHGTQVDYVGANGTVPGAFAGTGKVVIREDSLLALARADAIGTGINVDINESHLVLAANGTRLGNVTLSNGRMSFNNPPGIFVTGTLKSLHGASTLIFNVDFDTGKANHLTITDAATGEHEVSIAHTGDPAAASIAIIKNPEGFTANYRYNPIETALERYDAVPGDGSAARPDRNAVYFHSSGLSSTADAILATASLQGRDWLYSLDALYLRMGDIRADPNYAKAGNPPGSFWVRARSHRLNASISSQGNETGAINGQSFHQYGHGLTAGVDRVHARGAGTIFVGAFIDTGIVDRDFDNYGNGESETIGAGVYGSWLHEKGWFADITLKLDHVKNDFDARASDGKLSHGSYKNYAKGVSLEIGRRLVNKNGWWVEPSVQAAYVHLNSAAYQVHGAYGPNFVQANVPSPVSVHLDATSAFQSRAGLRIGRQLGATRWHPYGKAAVAGSFSNGGEVTAEGKTLASDYDGCRVEAGFGASFIINARHALYLDFEYAKADDYERPWSINIGYRACW
ncbi:autotransporter outer membrane beta-barrel domain-containing protein [Termitidicoccus mucosus]|uniref:Autotransporter domain-containing protein n=1 Tax=Termitidicoccus mucosus TaxID=1184151 RepID=A0A178IMP0_9BACT|nr:hypothetical protein AW736_07775 [Opitutaceae bacterium TSB47]